MRFNRRNSVPRGTQMTYDGGLCFPLRRIANMDQTPLPFEYLCGKTCLQGGQDCLGQVNSQRLGKAIGNICTNGLYGWDPLC